MDYSVDYYQILGILDTANQEEIRRAYRSLALLWHPDMHIGESPERIAAAEENFKIIAQAYEILSDPQKRIEYDRLRACYNQRTEQRNYHRSAGQSQQHHNSEGGGYSRQYYGSRYGYYYQQTAANQAPPSRHNRWESIRNWFSRNIYGFFVGLVICLFQCGFNPLANIRESYKTYEQRYDWVSNKPITIYNSGFHGANNIGYSKIQTPGFQLEVPEIVIPDIIFSADSAEDSMAVIKYKILEMQKQLQKQKSFTR